MKATLIFKIPEEQSEFNDAIRGSDYLYALNKIREYLRSELKYNEQLNDLERHAFEKIREEFNGILTDNDINL
jgi:hypothetical protein